MKISKVYCSPESNGKVSYILTFGKQFYLEDILGINNARLFIKDPGFFKLSFKPIKPKIYCTLAWKSYPVTSYLARGKSLESLMFGSPGKYFLMFGNKVNTEFFQDNTWYKEMFMFFPEDNKISLSTLLYKSFYLENDFQRLVFTNSVLNQVNESNGVFVMYNNLIKSRGYWIKEISRYNIYSIFN